MNQAEASVSWLSDKLPQMERYLADLVNINSFTENIAGGNQVGGLLETLFRESGLTAQRVASKRFADHWVFRSEGNGSAPIALLGHHDTVFPPGTFEGYRVDGPLRRGPGVLDMKGGLVVMAFAVRALAETGGLAGLPPLRVVVVSDEEVGSPEGGAVIQQSIGGSRGALVFESGRAMDAIVTRRKGTGALEVKAHGKSAHAGNAHEEGRNAIWSLARFIDGAQEMTDYSTGVTVNVGRIAGGRSKNTVPDFATAQFDFRFLNRAQGEALVERLRQLAQSVAVEGTRLELEGGVAREPLERTEASQALMATYGACAKACGLGHGEAPLMGGGSDASTAHAMGIPAIDGLGPRGQGFHTLDEHLEVNSLIPKAQALARFLSSLRA